MEFRAASFFYYDEMSHAMNGAFFRDLLLDFPWHHPINYAYQYYAKYPAISFPHWPPLFHFIEGLFLLAFGLAPWVSRLAILCFALMGIYFWYRIAEKLGPRYRAFLSALALACAPFILLYERVIMLEIPSLATCLGAIYFWMKFQEEERQRDLMALTAFVIAAFLVSQKAIFLLVFIGLNLVVEGRYQVLKRKDTWLALFIAFLAIFPGTSWRRKRCAISGPARSAKTPASSCNPGPTLFISATFIVSSARCCWVSDASAW